MAMRITTSMTMNTYRYNLMGSNVRVNDAMNKVLTKRNFNSYSEDPAAAAHAWRIRRAFTKNNAYIANNSDTFSRYRIAYAAMDKIKTDLANNDGLKDAVLGNSDPLASGRYALGSVVYNGAESVIQAINGAKYGDHFVFAGKDGLNVPYSWSDDGKTLYYRGVNVDAGGVPVPKAEEIPAFTQGLQDELDNVLNDATATDEDRANAQAWYDYYTHKTDTKPEGTEPPGFKAALDKALSDIKADPNMSADEKEVAKGWHDYYTHASEEIPDDAMPLWLKTGEKDQYGYPTQETIDKRKADQGGQLSDKDQEWLTYLKDQSDLNRLKEMDEEQTNVDLGLGLQEDENGEIVNGSVFNMALPGLRMLGGYGVDEDGDPRNLATLMKKYAAVLERADPETGQWSEEDRAEADRLLNKINKTNNNVIKSYSDDVAASAEFLETNGERLEEQGYALNQERAAIEDIDPADAISAFLYDYTCYNAALKVGTQILSQSLIDYMN